MRLGATRVLLIACAAVVAGPLSAAHAALITPDSRCYFAGAHMNVAAAGFTPGRTVTVAGRGVGLAAPVGPSGAATLSGKAPPLLDPKPIFTARVPLRGTDGSLEAFSYLDVTNRRLLHSPPKASPGRVVRWRPTGFAPGRVIYAHYVFRGRSRKTVRLGVMPARCAYLSRRVRLLPFARPARGRWTVQIDAVRAYRSLAVGRLRSTVTVP